MFSLLFDCRDGQRLERKNEEEILARYASEAETELAVYHSWLHCQIEGIESDRLLIRFSHVDEADPAREFSFVLDLSVQSYKGRFCVDLVCLKLIFIQ